MFVSLLFHVFFFVKQKTAYEMRISDWSSDVGSSDLAEFEQIGPVQSILDFDPNEEPPALACFKNTRQIVELTTDSPQQGQHIGAYVRAIRAGLAKHYDYCVIDTAPAWDGRNLMALIASDYVAVPLEDRKSTRLNSSH